MPTPASDSQSELSNSKQETETKAYAITISRNGRDGVLSKWITEDERSDRRTAIREDIVSLFYYLFEREKVTRINSDYKIEESKTGKIHLHGMFSTNDKFLYKNMQCGGYQVYIRELRSEGDEMEWYRYITKDEYMFVDE